MQADIIKEVLEECWPLECDAVGPALLKDIVAERELEATAAGSNLTQGEASALLILALGVVKELLGVANEIVKIQKRIPSAEEVAKGTSLTAETVDPTTPTIDDTKRAEAAKSVVDRVKIEV
jgi:hypothetical protein